jgi:segregation and condensation protein B
MAAAGPSMARRSRLEAVLILSREPLSLRKLAQLANLTDGTEARTLLEGLRRRYDERGCAFQVAQVAGGYQLLSRPKFESWLRPLAAGGEETRLSPPALETLAVVAYRQPVLRAEVEAIRGVGCGEILRQLMDRDLLRIVGRSEELGRPLWYGTTKRFLQVFGMCNLDQLPLADELRRMSQVALMAAESPVSNPDHDAGLTGDVDAA